MRGLGVGGCKLKGGLGVCSITTLCVWPAISSPPLRNRHFRREAQQPNKDCHGGEESGIINPFRSRISFSHNIAIHSVPTTIDKYSVHIPYRAFLRLSLCLFFFLLYSVSFQFQATWNIRNVRSSWQLDITLGARTLCSEISDADRSSSEDGGQTVSVQDVKRLG